MSRFHMHVAVSDLERSIRYYNAVFGAEPTLRRTDYARWSLEEPRIHFAISSRGDHTGLDHVGIQAESAAELAALQARLAAADIAGAAQPDAACCYARSDKYWSRDPEGIAWEAFHTLASIPTFGAGQETRSAQSCCVIPGLSGDGCC